MNSAKQAEVEPQPQPFDASRLEPAKKRKRSQSPPHANTKRARSTSPPVASKDSQPTASEPEPPKRKRPTGRARITDAEREIIRQRQLEREKELEAVSASRGIHNVVREH
jgi:mRNA (guanine-N7-)-methyltransferase